MNEELKPCPFCGSTNSYVYGYQHDAGLRWRVVCLDCMAMVGTEQQKYRAIEAWNRRAAPENKPLTLEQLRQMDGEPVWIDGKDYGGWTIFKASTNKQVARCLDNVNLSYYMDNYGRTWLAYARKPEEPHG